MWMISVLLITLWMVLAILGVTMFGLTHYVFASALVTIELLTRHPKIRAANPR